MATSMIIGNTKECEWNIALMSDHCPSRQGAMSAYWSYLLCAFYTQVKQQNPAMAPGERSEEAYLWFSTVCEAIQEIPRGKVTSYAHIARLVGKRK